MHAELATLRREEGIVRHDGGDELLEVELRRREHLVRLLDSGPSLVRSDRKADHFDHLRSGTDSRRFKIVAREGSLRPLPRSWQSGCDVGDLHPKEGVHGIGVVPVMPEHRHLEARDLHGRLERGEAELSR